MAALVAQFDIAQRELPEQFPLLPQVDGEGEGGAVRGTRRRILTHVEKTL